MRCRTTFFFFSRLALILIAALVFYKCQSLSLIAVVKQNDVKKARSLLAAGADVNEVDVNFARPLHYAVQQNNVAMIQELLTHEAIQIDAGDAKGQSALHSAAKRGFLSIAVLLIAKNANVNQRDNVGASVLHLAAHGGHTQMIQLLIDKGANVNARDVSGLTPLKYALQQGNLAAIRTLRKNGASTGQSYRY